MDASTVMEWISVEEKPIDYQRIHLSAMGNRIFISGTDLQPFFMQLCGEMIYIKDYRPTHWMPLPKPPIPRSDKTDHQETQ